VWVAGALVRRAVLETLDADSRRRLHGRVVVHLERLGAADDDDRIEELASHAARAVDHQRAATYLKRAAALAEARGELALAAERFALAARFVHEDGEGAADARAVSLVLRAARLALSIHEPVLAERILRESEALVLDAGPVPRMQYGIAHAEALGRRERWGEALVVLRDLAGLAETLDDRSLRGRYLAVLGWTTAQVGEVDEASQVLADAVRELHEIDGAAAGAGQAALAILLSYAGKRTEAEAAALVALATATRFGEPSLRWMALSALAESAEADGDVAGAAQRWDEASDVAREGDLPRERAISAVRAAMAWLEHGDVSRASIAADEAAALARRYRLEVVAELTASTQAVLAALEHPDPIYIARVARSVDRLESIERPGPAALAAHILARGHFAVGDQTSAVEALDRAATLAQVAGWVALSAQLVATARRLTSP
jgi:hypothetical protein